MAEPEMIQARLGDEILALILVAKEGFEGLQPFHRFTWNIEAALEPGSRLALVHQAALRRAWTRIAASAAGVMPRIRAAAPRLEGRARDSRSTISFERPGTRPKAKSAGICTASSPFSRAISLCCRAT